MRLIQYLLLLLLLMTSTIGPVVSAPARANQQVLVVLIFDQSCKAWCQKVRPMMKELGEVYGDKVVFAELDASHDKLKEAEGRAKELGVYNFLSDSADWVPIVGVFNPQRKLVKELVGPKQKEVYAGAIDKALACK
jgi:hypothetical protein